MKIGLDASTIKENKAGIGYFTYGIAKALITVDKKNTYILYTNKKENLQEFQDVSNCIIHEIKSERAGFAWIISVAVRANIECNLFISPTSFTFGIIGKNVIQIVHDLAPIKFPKFFTKKGADSYKLLFNLMASRIKQIAVPLNAIEKEVIEYRPDLKNKVTVIGEGLHEWTYRQINEAEKLEVKDRYKLPSEYLLSVSTIEPRKNHVNMIRAFADVVEQYPNLKYIIAGKKGWYYEDIFKEVDKLRLGEKVIFLGYVPEEDLNGLYANAKGLMFCSFYEGFGLPLLEGASQAVPLVCSDIEAFREIVSPEEAEFVDPNSSASIASGIKKILKIEKKTSSKFSTSHTWENSAKNIIEIYKLIVAKRSQKIS